MSLYVFSILFIIIKVAAATTNSSGFCNVDETYTEPVQNVTKTASKQQCCPGYFLNKENGNCYPDCEVECTDYSCTRSNECMCKPGSEKTANSNRCKSICDDDYEWDTSESICRLKCSDGYYPTRNGSEQICKPLCSGGCLNGSCAEPEACQCSDGFEYNREFKGCIIRSDYCSVCSCVDTLFVYPFRPLNVPKLCFVMVLVAAIVVAIFCAISLFMYRRFIKRINHPFNLNVIYRKGKEREADPKASISS